MHLSWLLLVFSTLLRYTSALEPWYFTWTDPSGKEHSESGSTPDVCHKIDNPVGNHFDWTSSHGWCIYLWGNDNCTGMTAGHTCESWPWRHDSSQHLLSFKAVTNSSDLPDNSDAPPPPSQTNIDTANTTNASDANTDSAADNNSSHSLSGGAIAGIVVGVVVGVAILAAIAWFFLFYLRRQKKDETPDLSTENGPSETGQAPVEASAVPHNPVLMTLSEMPNDQKEKPGELTDNHVVEMDNSQRTAELDATETVMRRDDNHQC